MLRCTRSRRSRCAAQALDAGKQRLVLERPVDVGRPRHDQDVDLADRAGVGVRRQQQPAVGRGRTASGCDRDDLERWWRSVTDGEPRCRQEDLVGPAAVEQIDPS